MGSGSSRILPRSPRRRPEGRPKLKFAPFLCGGAEALAAGSSSSPSSSSSLSSKIKDKPSENSIISAGIDESITTHNIQTSGKESSENFSSTNRYAGSSNEDLISMRSNKNINPERSKSPSLASMSEKSNYLDMRNRESSLPAALELSDCINECDSQGSEISFSSSMPRLEHGGLPGNGTSSIDNPSNEVLGIQSPDSEFVSANPSETSPSSGHTTLSGSGKQRDGSILHVDLVSISANLPSGSGETSNNDARRNSSRFFWDAFSRSSSRRTFDSSLALLSTDNIDGLVSQERCQLNFGDRALLDGFEDDSMYFRRRRQGLSGVGWHSRPEEIRERIRAVFDDSNEQAMSCPTGLHQDGTCSCSSLIMAEVSSTRASIARIVMLAEALFEVLDEIHREPGSLSLSMVSVPAPDSVVSSLPSKNYKKLDGGEGKGDVEQCYICLGEYEDGESIRVLPCRHEYHTSCVDKWLKEVHGVCPLCRGNVCEVVNESSI